MKGNEKRVGRPPSKDAPSEYVGFRVARDTKAQLEASAAVSNRSLSDEVRHRIEESLHDEARAPLFYEAVYGRQLAAFLELLGRTLREVTSNAQYYGEGSARNGDWLSDPQAFSAVEASINEIFDWFRPPGNASPLTVNGVEAGPSFARGFTRRVAFGQSDSADDAARFGAEAREKFGAATAGRLIERFKQKESQHVGVQ